MFLGQQYLIKVKGNTSIDCASGPHTVLSTEEESRLSKWIIEMSQIGYGRSKHVRYSTENSV